MTGRTCHAIELNPAYVDVAVKRWQTFTGEKAILDGDGRTFDAVAAAHTVGMAEKESSEPRATPAFSSSFEPTEVVEPAGDGR
jgi:hypothetical protein